MPAVVTGAERKLVTSGALDNHGKAVHGVPGPGSYNHATAFGPLPMGHDRSPERMRLLSSAPAFTLSSRAFPPEPEADSPGPKYLPRLSQEGAKIQFGTSDRDQEARLFISKLHCAAQVARESPGPGTYRVGVQARRKRTRLTNRVPGFGTSPQREGVAREAVRVPGPVYDVPSSFQTGTRGATFGPQDARKGLKMSRNDGALMYISKLHAEADRSAAGEDIPAAKYNVENMELLSSKARSAAFSFPKKTRDAQSKEFISPEHARVDITSCSPGPAYSIPTMLNTSMGAVFGGTGTRFASPEQGPEKAGPFISKAHSHCEGMGSASPGPAAYDVRAGGTAAGEAPSYSFGSGHLPFVTATINPGPGTYHRQEQRQAILSHDISPPAFSMGSRAGAASLTSIAPGPGAYPVHNSDAINVQSTVSKAPAFKFGVKTEPASEKPLATPGPGTYPRRASADMLLHQGFSFGIKDRCRGGGATVNSVRYQGPLASNLDKGIDSPGPAAYSPNDSPTIKLPTTIRFGGDGDRSPSPKQFISKQHSNVVGLCMDSPGPHAYPSEQHGLSGFSNRYKNTGAFSFGRGDRPAMAAVKF